MNLLYSPNSTLSTLQTLYYNLHYKPRHVSPSSRALERKQCKYHREWPTPLLNKDVLFFLFQENQDWWSSSNDKFQKLLTNTQLQVNKPSLACYGKKFCNQKAYWPTSVYLIYKSLLFTCFSCAWYSSHYSRTISIAPTKRVWWKP